MYEHKHQIRVRYAETDQMQYVYYGNYLQYYEVGRVEAMRALGLSYAQMETEWDVMMPVMSANIAYLRPAFYDDLLTIVTTIPELPDREIVFQSTIYNELGKEVNKGTVVLCFVHKSGRKRISIPEQLLSKLKPHYEGW